MQKLFEAVLEISLAMTPIIILLLLLTPTLGKRYYARMRYFVWMIMAFRLLIPINVSLNSILRYISPTSNLLSQVDENAVMEAIRAALAMQIDGTASQVSQQNAGQSGLSLLGVLAIIWLAGFVFFLLYHAAAYFITYRNLQRWSIAVHDPLLRESFDKSKAVLSITKEIGFYHNDRVATPMLIGFLSPCILLPVRAVDASELANILSHELCHYKRRDLWYKLLLLLANGIQWFNPFVYLMLRRAEIDMELACDHDVLWNADSAARKQYGLTILSFIDGARSPCTPLTTCFYGGKNQMMQRFSEIVRTPKKKTGLVFLSTLLFAILLIGSLAGNVLAAPSAQNQQLNNKLLYPEENAYQGGEMSWPVPGFYSITSPYGERYGGTDFHTGIDISGEDIYGAPVIAAGDGKVTYVNRDYKPGVGYGIYLIIDHGGDITTLYGHLSEVSVNVGDVVEKGQQIGNIGSTGFATGPNLQFEVRENGITTDPIPYLTPKE